MKFKENYISNLEKIHLGLYQELEINGLNWNSFKWLSKSNVFLEIEKGKRKFYN
jgi:hypothetical protein